MLLSSQESTMAISRLVWSDRAFILTYGVTQSTLPLEWSLPERPDAYRQVAVTVKQSASQERFSKRLLRGYPLLLLSCIFTTSSGPFKYFLLKSLPKSLVHQWSSRWNVFLLIYLVLNLSLSKKLSLKVSFCHGACVSHTVCDIACPERWPVQDSATFSVDTETKNN